MYHKEGTGRPQQECRTPRGVPPTAGVLAMHAVRAPLHVGNVRRVIIHMSIQKLVVTSGFFPMASKLVQGIILLPCRLAGRKPGQEDGAERPVERLARIDPRDYTIP